MTRFSILLGLGAILITGAPAIAQTDVPTCRDAESGQQCRNRHGDIMTRPERGPRGPRPEPQELPADIDPETVQSCRITQPGDWCRARDGNYYIRPERGMGRRGAGPAAVEAQNPGGAGPAAMEVEDSGQSRRVPGERVMQPEYGTGSGAETTEGGSQQATGHRVWRPNAAAAGEGGSTPESTNMESEFTDEDGCDDAPPMNERPSNEWVGCPETEPRDTGGEESGNEGGNSGSAVSGGMIIQEGPDPDSGN